jgi:NADH:ubiquinone oxidoreductase subunit E
MDYGAIVRKYPPRRDYLLMILRDIQEAEPQNYVSREAMRSVADYLNVTGAAVYGMVGYYSMLSEHPRGRHIIRLCRSPVCRMLGAFDLQAALEEQLGVRMGATTADGSFTLESSECLGNCHRAPSMMIDEVLYSGVTETKLGRILDRVRSGQEREGEASNG